MVEQKARTCHFLEGGGELGKLVRSFDWSQTPIGPVDEWPQSLPARKISTFTEMLQRNRCEKIALNHNGDIYAESSEGKGAAFHVLLPLRH